eukprot:COSAG01_NODE_7337_length_3244_cov_3.393005_4_plen_129_part_00
MSSQYNGRFQLIYICRRAFVCRNRQKLREAQNGEFLSDDVREMLSMQSLAVARLWLSTKADEHDAQRVQRLCSAARAHQILTEVRQYKQMERVFSQDWQRVIYSWAPTAPQQDSAELQVRLIYRVDFV